MKVNETLRDMVFQVIDNQIEANDPAKTCPFPSSFCLRSVFHPMIRKLIAIKSILMAALLGGIALLSVCSCATVPTKAPSAGEVRLLGIAVEDSDYVKANAPITVDIKFEAAGKPEIKRICFSFSKEGPYCTDVKDYMYVSPGIIQVHTFAIIKKNVSEFYLHPLILEGYILYEREGKRVPSNVVSTSIQVYKVK